MKNKHILISLSIAAAMMFAGYLIGYYGTLLGSLLTSVGLFLLGAVLLVSAVKKRADIKISFLVFLICGAMLIIGGKGLIGAVFDLSKGPQEIHLKECTVQSHKKLGSLFGSYELCGTDEDGNVCHYSIDKKMFQKYLSVDAFSIDVAVWEYSDVVKEIY